MMNCKQTIERLPWLLNGTLEGEELQEVRQHLSDCASCREELREISFVGEAVGQHLSVETLVTLGATSGTLTGTLPGTLPEEEASLVEEHLASCVDCTEQLAMARQSYRLATASEGEAPVVAFARRPPPKPVWRGALLAASLATLVASAGWWTTWQRAADLRADLRNVESVAALNQPALGADTGAEIHQPIFRLGDIYSQQLVYREGESSSEEPNRLQLPPAAETITLLLNGAPATNHDTYGVEISDLEGQVLWNLDGLKQQPEGLLLTVQTLPSNFTVQVFGLAQSAIDPGGDTEGVRTLLDRYPVVLESL